MKRIGGLILMIGLILGAAQPTWAEQELDGKYMTLRDGGGRVVCRTAHRAVIGDRYLAGDNRLYQVYQVKGLEAKLKLVRREKTGRNWLSRAQSFGDGISDLIQGKVNAKGPIGIYHTHTDESYNPTDGVSSKKSRGGVMDVGDSLAKAFEKNGVPVVHNQTLNNPHDAMAYDRSRRTAAQLLRQRPTALLDVHRDAVPRQEYATVIGGRGVTKVQLVVGRENPNFQATNDFARRIKTVVDRKCPGLIKGIFYGKGKYNQDLTPRTILLEFGSNTNSKESAERSAAIFAAAAKDALYGAAGMGIAGRGSWRSLFWIIVAAVGGTALFLLMNRSGFKDMAKEFTGAVGEDQVKSDQTENQGKERHGDSP